MVLLNPRQGKVEKCPKGLPSRAWALLCKGRGIEAWSIVDGPEASVVINPRLPFGGGGGGGGAREGPQVNIPRLNTQPLNPKP